MKKIMMLFALMLSFVFKAMAENVNALTLWMASGKRITCMLDESPVVKFQGDDFILSTQMHVMSYPAADVLRFTLSCIPPASIKAPCVSDTGFTFDGGQLKGFNLEPKSRIEIYSLDGRLVTAAITDGNGYVCISIPSASGDVCIVKTSIVNFKIMKP